MMYTIYNQTTGQILRVVGTDNIEIQLTRDEAYLEGSFDDTKYYVENGKLVELPIKPSQYHNFNYETKQWVEDTTKLISYILSKRKNLLLSTDWTQLPNGPLTAEKQSAWVTYRQQLRDITTQTGYPLTVTWPVAPGSTPTT